MKNIFISIIFLFISTSVIGQTIKLTDYLIYPRLDSTYWEKDYDVLNSVYSAVVNRCQTCVFNETDSTRGRFCFNTSLGHVQMDTTLHNFTPEKLIGKWEVVNFGLVEIADSILPDSKVYYRTEKILNEQKDASGLILVTDKHFKTELKNIKDIPNKNKRYKILNGRFLTIKTLSGYCGATILGITKDNFLILDDHTYRTIAKKESYLVVRTTIRRVILKKSTAT